MIVDDRLHEYSNKTYIAILESHTPTSTTNYMIAFFRCPHCLRWYAGVVRFCSKFATRPYPYQSTTETYCYTQTHTLARARLPCRLIHADTQSSSQFSAAMYFDCAPLRTAKEKTEKSNNNSNHSPKTIHTIHGMISIIPFMYKMNEPMTHPFSFTLLAVLITQQNQSSKQTENILYFVFVSAQFLPTSITHKRFW